MRKITQEAVNAFMAHEDYRSGNTEVYQSMEGPILSLHGNKIARLECNYETEQDTLYITNAGWRSNVTKERLNGLPGVSILQKKGVWYLNGTDWDGSWTAIKI